jgi:O-antigen/teichoic acid export membrane protein
VAGLFLLGPLVLYWPVTFGGQSMVPFDALVADPVFQPQLAAAGVTRPQNDLVADLVFQNVVWKTFLVDSIRDGQVPLWNPNIAGGVPFLAAGQHGAFYPSTLLFLWLGPARGFGWNALLAAWLAAVGMYLLGRALGLGRFAATFMGLLWSLGSLLVVNAVFPMIQGGLAWTPVVLAAIEWTTRAMRDEPGGRLPRGRAMVALMALALATALLAFSGHVEMLYYAALVASAYGLFRVLATGRRQGWRSGLTLGVWLLVAAVVGGMLAAVQLVPLVELARANWRSGSEAYDTIAGYAFGLRQAVTFLIPDFYGNPADHSAWDVVARQQVALAGHSMWGNAWGTKNYVEAAAYLGVLAPALALIGLAAGRRRAQAIFWGLLALAALSFAFGLPSYRLLFFGLPGFDQLHTPFRWVFPYGLAVTVLAGLGAQRLADGGPARSARWIGTAAVVVGTVLGAVVAGAWLAPARAVGLAERLLQGLSGAGEAVQAQFAGTSAFAGYELSNLLHLAIFLTLAGVLILALTRLPVGHPRRPLLLGTLLAVAALDLLLIGIGFNPAVDPALAQQPPTARWLADAQNAKWGRVMGFGDARVLWPNSAGRYGVPDLRAYDSILPRWTVAALNAIEDQACRPPAEDDGACLLQFNRIGNLTRTASLAHPMLAALGGRYILTTGELGVPGLQRVHDGDVKVYENTRALPRAWVVNHVEVIADEAQLLATLDSFDPAHTALLDAPTRENQWRDIPTGRPVPSFTKVRRDEPGELELDVTAPASGGLLVVSEAWFPGWKAYVVGGSATGFGAEAPEVEVPVYRADGMLLAVPVAAGRSSIRLVYSPMSVKLGLYITFLGLIALLLAAVYALWTRFVPDQHSDPARVVAVNSAGPMFLALTNKAVDFAFAMLMLRVLGPADAGAYYTAISIIGFADIFTNFGLNLLVAREVARDPSRTGEYLTHTTTLRVILWLVSLPLMAGYVLFRSATGTPLGPETVLALALFAGALLPSNLASALSSVFQAHERMLTPASVAVGTTLLKVSLGALVLLAGLGYVGLAGVSVVVNWATFAVLAVLAAKAGYRAVPRVVWPVVWGMVAVALPLMLNHLLQSVFFKIDVLLLSQMKGDEVVGWYSAAYKWVDAFLIIPAYAVLALFPLMSRRADTDQSGLTRAYEMARRWLVVLALPIAVAVTFLADELVGLLGGQQYLPHGAQALRVMIWFLPFSFVNGLSQYVLIAIHRQRWITVSFIGATTFNLIANLLVIPPYGYVGAAVVTIVTELVLMLPFQRGLRDLNALPLLAAVWRPALAASVMALSLAGLDALGLPRILSAGLGAAVFTLVLLRLGGLTPADRQLLLRLLPQRGPAAEAASEVPSG